ncbi:MAG: GNAT family N-acetyltransferase [Elusimicrobiota bacterium]|nr:MAG: GNAT family N-acetyltransferase [Elusimicrobiota bacterium]
MKPTIKPLTPARWKDFEALFGPRGACDGCWCHWIRLPRKEFEAARGDGAKAMMKALVDSGEPTGLLAYEGKRAVGWAALAPRSKFRRLEKSRVLKPVDEKPVWSLPCFFVAKDSRGKGVTTALLKAAAVHAAQKGAKLLEGYPVDTKGRKTADAFVWWGLSGAFEKAGFKAVARRSKTRPIMRRAIR